eukprot:NODE_10306_length_1361_cov_9.135332.p1 GENE.NODE_10306_length_1361_cov_9.135332~~NODE_10306_length_1361_cov_9.135332.p1  ORF type:complete len:333 (-),score=53.91 NODE_10306_length_1361_cov_9.135332:317-1315(-)
MELFWGAQATSIEHRMPRRPHVTIMWPMHEPVPASARDALHRLHRLLLRTIGVSIGFFVVQAALHLQHATVHHPSAPATNAGPALGGETPSEGVFLADGNMLAITPRRSDYHFSTLLLALTGLMLIPWPLNWTVRDLPERLLALLTAAFAIFVSDCWKIVHKAEVLPNPRFWISAHCPMASEELNEVLDEAWERLCRRHLGRFPLPLPPSEALPQRLYPPGLLIDMCSPVQLLGNLHVAVSCVLVMWMLSTVITALSYLHTASSLHADLELMAAGAVLHPAAVVATAAASADERVGGPVSPRPPLAADTATPGMPHAARWVSTNGGPWRLGL